MTCLAYARRALFAATAALIPCSLFGQQTSIISYTPHPPPPPEASSSGEALSKTQVDPIYATMYGGTGYDEMLAHASNRDVTCMVGLTTSTDLMLFAPFQSQNAGGTDGWIGCGDITTGLPYLASYLGSNGEETITGVDILDDTLFVVGVTTSQTMPGAVGAYQDSTGGGQDCFITRVNVHDGSGLKTTLFGRDGQEYCSGISVGRAGVWVGGTASKAIDFVNALQDEVRGPTDAMLFLLSLDLNQLLFSSVFGGEGGDGAERIGVSRVFDRDSTSKGDTYEEVTTPLRVVLAGFTDSNELPVTADAFQSDHGGGYDGFYATFLYDRSVLQAQLEYATYFGRGGDDVPRDLSFNRGRVALTGWTTSPDWNTIGRNRNGGSSDGFVYIDECFGETHNPIVSYVGPSSNYNLPLAITKAPFGVTVVGGYSVVPSVGNAFLQAYDRTFGVIGTEFSGGASPADCNTIEASAYWWACGGKTSGPIPTTQLAVQSDFRGDFDMFGSKYKTPYSYSSLLNMTDFDITGVLNDTQLDTLKSRGVGRPSILSWNRDYIYQLSGGGKTYQFDRRYDDTSARLTYTYLFADRALRVDAPEVNYGELGILAYNDLLRSLEIYRTDQTTEHNEIKRTTVEPGEFFFLSFPKDQNFGITDGVDFIEFRRKRIHRKLLPYLAGYVREKVAKGSGSQGFELVLFDADGRPIELPVTTAVDDPGSIPAAMTLFAGYPNPFRVSTTLRFDLPELARVRLSVYDIVGRRVRTLVDELRSPGTTSVIWDGRDESGRTVASGTYLARLEAGGRFATKTMVFAK